MEKRTLPLKIIVNPFNGDPDLLNFFIEQITTKQKLTNWSDEQTLLFLKSKLSEKALKFYATSTQSQNATSPKELFDIFKKVFKGESAQNISIQYNNIKFNSNECIRTFANKLQNLVYKRFPNLPPDSIEQILIAKFSDTIPPAYKLHILPLRISKFEEMVDALSAYQDIMSSEISPNSSQPSFALINSMKSQPIPDNSCNLSDNTLACSVNAQLVDDSSSKSCSVNNFQSKPRVKCQWCFRFGHSASKCFDLQKSNSVPNHVSNNVPYQRPYSQKFRQRTPSRSASLSSDSASRNATFQNYKRIHSRHFKPRNVRSNQQSQKRD